MRLQRAPPTSRDGRSTRRAPVANPGHGLNSHTFGMELETVIVRLHECTGEVRGFVELPAAWSLAPGDLPLDDECRPVRVVALVPCPLGSSIAALVKVATAPTMAREP